MSRQTRKRTKKALPPAEWLRRRARHWDRRDLAFATALRAAAAELAPVRWAPQWETMDPVHQARVVALMRREAIASSEALVTAAAAEHGRAEAFDAAADRLDLTRGARAAE